MKGFNFLKLHEFELFYFFVYFCVVAVILREESVDTNKIEELFEKVRTAGKIIAEYKQLLDAERSKVGDLKKQIAFLQKDNQCLKEENDKLKKLSSTAEKMHKELEDKIISMLDVLPDFDAIKNESSAPAVETISPSIMEMDFNGNKEEVKKEESNSFIFDNAAKEPVTDVENESVVIESGSVNSEESPFAMEENEIDFESMNSSAEDTKLLYFESEENIDYKNMFAFENMFESESNSKSSERKPSRELPKGVL